VGNVAGCADFCLRWPRACPGRQPSAAFVAMEQPAVPKNIGRVRVNPGGFFELEFAADSNQLFTVLGSTNLLNWTPLGILRRPDVVVALTSPPLISFVAACYAGVRRCGFVYWIMDLNPDEAIAAGWVRERSLPARVLNWLSEFSLQRARTIFVLDRFMHERV